MFRKMDGNNMTLGPQMTPPFRILTLSTLCVVPPSSSARASDGETTVEPATCEESCVRADGVLAVN